MEISWVLASRYRGYGLATEAATAVLDFARVNLNRQRIVAVIAPENIDSIRVARRIGMEYVDDVTYKDFGLVQLFVWERGVRLDGGQT
jgi:ribosomal-protein-alanine N-acetyltransferase